MKQIKYKLSNGKIVTVKTTDEVANYLSICELEEKRAKWREKKRNDISLEYLEEINAQIADTSPTPLQILEQKESHDFYSLDLPLPNNLKRVLILRFREELTMREIAEKLQIPKSTAHHRLKKALEILKVGQNNASHSLYSVGRNTKQNKTEE